MATRAVYTFSGFPCVPERHLYLHHDAYPTGAAWRFAQALREAPEPETFLAAFLVNQPKAEPIETQEQAADAEYHYRVELLPGLIAQLKVQGGDDFLAVATGIPAAARCRWRCSSSASYPVAFPIDHRSSAQHLPMGAQKLLLRAAERSDQIRPLDPPAAQRPSSRLVLAQQLPAGIEADPMAVEQLVHMGGEQQAGSRSATR